MQLNLALGEDIKILKLPQKGAPEGKFLNYLPDNCIIADLETTGLRPSSDEIIEISAIKVINNKRCADFSTLINPKRKINYYITKLTGITDSMVQNAPDIKTVLPDFYEFSEDLPIVGHNIKFDLAFLNANFKKHYDTRLSNDFSDTLYFARKKYTNLKHHKLSLIAEYLNIDTTGAHRGLKDCEMTYKIFLDLKKEPPTTIYY